MKKLGMVAVFTLAINSIFSIAMAAPQSGSACAKLGSSTRIAGKPFLCTAVGKKKIWKAQKSSQGVSTESTKATSTVEASKNPDPVKSAREMFANVETCKVNSPSPRAEQLGFSRDSQNIATVGIQRSVVLFVDFNDVKGESSLFDEWRLHQIPTMEKTYSAMSFGKLTYTIDLVPRIFHINKDSVSYLLNTPHDDPPNPKASPSTLVHDAMTAADSIVDFSKYEFINVVTPTSENFLYEGATGIRETFDGKVFTGATFSSERQYINQDNQANWLVHETGHLMGLIHNYDTADSKGTYSAKGFQLPVWDAMTFPLTTAPDFFGWSKFILGWVSDNQVDCLGFPILNSTTHLISPIGSASNKTKIVVVKLDASNVLVIESRRNSPVDSLKTEQEGILVYKVNMLTESSRGAIELFFNNANVSNIPGDKGRWGSGATFRVAYGNLVPGETLKTQGLIIQYQKRVDEGDFVTISSAS